MSLIARYITKEVLWNSLVITGILLLVVLSNRFAIYLAKAATGELPIGLVFQIVVLYIPELLSYLIPLGFFMGILFAHGRLHVDSEMIVLAACGIGWRAIIQMTLLLALFILLLTAALTLWAVPHVADIREQALSKGEAFGVMQSLLPGRFQTFAEGKLVFYLEDAAPKQETLKGIFIAERPEQTKSDSKNNQVMPHGWALITAEQAHIKRDPISHDYYVVLKNGDRYQGLPGSADYTLVQFQEYGRLIPKEHESTQNDALRLKNTSTLLHSSLKEDAAELQWRLSLPLTVPILALIAIPLACVHPRFGRFAKFVPAIAIYILYYNLFTISKRWVTAGTLSTMLGVWWVHVIFIALGLILIGKESGWFQRMRRRVQ
jgi:lipopolysaccharide export system permease protein